MFWLALQPLPEALAPDAKGSPLPAATSTALDAAAHASAPAPLADALSALAWCALQFTPRVARVGDALVLEVSASERLFGGRRALLQTLANTVEAVAPVRRARGDTALLALARLQAPDVKTIDALPLHTLAAAQPHLPTLERLGVRHWGQLRALPRAGLARRFGAELVDALDRAYGQQPEAYPWLAWPEVFDMPLELPTHVESAPSLLFAARRLLAQLHVWLRARQRGVLAFELAWQLDARRSLLETQGSVRISSATPTLDMAHLQRLLGEHLARVSLPAPAVALRLRTQETAPLGGATSSLLPDEQRLGDSWQQMLERLVARLGPEQVLQPSARADHRPECMQQWHSASVTLPALAAAAKPGRRATARPATTRTSAQGASALYPSWLLQAPLKLVVHKDDTLPQYQGRVTLLAGPQRLEAGWWDNRDGRLGGGKATRDYYIARSPQAGLLWLYRERVPRSQQQPGQPDDWYLHGLFA